MRLKIWLSVLLVMVLGIGVQAKETVVFWFGATQDERAAYEQMIKDFNRTHPDIEVKPMLVPQSYVERKLILSVAGQVPPDVVRFYTHLGGEMMSRGGLEPLDDLIKKDQFDLKDFYPVGIQQNTYKGHLYGIPWVLSPEALFYNKKLFREAGLDPNRPPRTWEELREYAMKLTVRDGKGGIERVGFAGFLNNPPDFHRYLWQNGGSPLSPDMKHIAFNSPEGVQALTWMRDFLVEEVGPKDKNIDRAAACAEAVRNLQIFNSAFVGASQDVFGMEKLAMRIESPFRIPDLKKYFPKLDYGLAPVPYNKVKSVEVVGNALVIPKGSKHKAAAWEFIKFATSRTQVLSVCKVAGRVPARRSVARSPEFYSNVVMRPFVDQIDYGRTTPVAPGYREVSDVLARKIEATLKGSVPTESLWQQFVRSITHAPAPKVTMLDPKEALDQASVKGQRILDVANEDMGRHALVPWKTLGIVTGIVLLAAIVAGYWQVLKKTKSSNRARREAMTFYTFLSPWLIGFLVLTLGSTLASLLFSFCKWDILSPARVVGFGNFSDLFNDPRFLKAIGNTLYYAFFSIPLAITGGLLISVMLNQKLRGIQIFRTIYYLPVVVSGVATALLWQFIFNPKSGLINKALMLFMEQPPQWFMDPAWAKPAFVIMGLWGVGGAMVIYLAGLQGIPEELYEAAKLDGASPWQTFRRITLPMLTPTIFYQLVIGTMAAFQFFTPAYIMTGGGPEDSTLFYSLYLFKNAFEWMKMGYASAMAWILFAIVLIITVLQFKGAGKWVYYEGKSEE